MSNKQMLVTTGMGSFMYNDMKKFGLSRKQTNELTSKYKSNSVISTIEEYLSNIFNDASFEVNRVSFDNASMIEEFMITKIEASEEADEQTCEQDKKIIEELIESGFISLNVLKKEINNNIEDKENSLTAIRVLENVLKGLKEGIK